MALASGVTAGSFGLAMAVQNLAWGASQPFVGYLADRFGARIVLLAAGPVYVIGLLLMAYGDAYGLIVGGGVLIGLAVSGSAFGVVLGAVSRAAPSPSPSSRPQALSEPWSWRPSRRCGSKDTAGASRLSPSPLLRGRSA